MQKYLGVNLVHAQSNTKIIDNKSYQGYTVRYRDGYETWFPQALFEKLHMPVCEDNSFSIQQIKMLMNKADIQAELLGKTLVVACKLPNGMTLVENHTFRHDRCVDITYGKRICLGKIESQLWETLDTLIKVGVEGFNVL